MLIDIAKLENAGFEVIVNDNQIKIEAVSHGAEELAQAMANTMSNVDYATRDLLIDKAVTAYNNQVILMLCS